MNHSPETDGNSKVNHCTYVEVMRLASNLGVYIDEQNKIMTNKRYLTDELRFTSQLAFVDVAKG